MNQMNFLEETLTKLQNFGKTEKDIKWVGCDQFKTSWEQFKKHANFNYDNGYGGVEINPKIVICGEDWWLCRGEYDGSEWWEYKTLPQEPTENLPDCDIKEFLTTHCLDNDEKNNIKRYNCEKTNCEAFMYGDCWYSGKRYYV